MNLFHIYYILIIKVKHLARHLLDSKDNLGMILGFGDLEVKRGVNLWQTKRRKTGDS